MALDFPVHPRLKESEELAVRRLVEQEPLLDRTTVVTGLIIIGLQIVTGADGLERLLSVLRRRKQPGYALPAMQAAEGVA